MLDASRLKQFVNKHMKHNDDGEAKAPRKSKHGIAESPESLQAYLESHGCPVKEVRDGARGARVLVLDGCPMNPEHGKGTDTAVIWRPTGIGFKCQHNGCTKFVWKHVRDQIEPDRTDRREVSKAAGDEAFRIGDVDPKSGKLILSHADPLPSGRVFLNARYVRDGVLTIRHYADVSYVWDGNRYIPIDVQKLRQQLYHFTEQAVAPKETRSGEAVLVRFRPGPAKISALLDTVRVEAHLDSTLTPPAWLEHDEDHPPVGELIPCATGTLHVQTRRWLPPTPKLFNTAALPFDYDKSAPPPRLWLGFLHQLWPADPQAVMALQEWFGYCLTGMTQYQKMLLLVGPRRSGKETIGRVLRELVGAPNVAGPTISSLATQFGLQPLIGASVAIVSDARFSKDGASPIVIERLLCISGEDLLSIDRKHLHSINMRLPTRFMFLTNELPRLADTSGALAGRFIVLTLQKSFYGNEDTELMGKLHRELAGILLWSLEGLKRLQRNGKFTQPESGMEAVGQLADLASPVGAFVREYCCVGDDYQVRIDDLFEAWKVWAQKQGRDRPGTKQAFCRDLHAAIPQIRARQARESGGRHRIYLGIGLRHALARDPENCKSEAALDPPSDIATGYPMPGTACHRVPVADLGVPEANPTDGRPL